MCLAAVVQIIEGMRVIGWITTATAVFAIYCVLVGLVIILIIVLEVLNIKWEREKSNQA